MAEFDREAARRKHFEAMADIKAKEEAEKAQAAKKEAEAPGFIDQVLEVSGKPLEALGGAVEKYIANPLTGYDPAVEQEKLQAASQPGTGQPGAALSHLYGTELVDIGPSDTEIAEMRAADAEAQQEAQKAAGETVAAKEGIAAGDRQIADLTDLEKQEEDRRAEHTTRMEDSDKKLADRNTELNKEKGIIQAEINNYQQQIDEMEPKSFWQKDNTGDKIMMALAVAMGALGQGISGSQSNAALTMMNKVIAEDLNAQHAAVNKKIMLMDEKKAGFGAIAAAKDQAKVNAKIRTGKSLDILNGYLEQLKGNTNNANTIGAIEQQQAKLQGAIVANKQALPGVIEKTADRAVQRSTNAKNVNSNLLEAADPEQQEGLALLGENKYTDKPFGEGMTLKPFQAEAAMFLVNNDPIVKNIEELEKNLTTAEWEAYKKVVTSAIQRGKREAAAGGLLGISEEKIRGSLDEMFEIALPGKGAQLFNAVFTFTQNQTRKESGAAISASEFVGTMMKYIPTVTATEAGIIQYRDNRRNLLKGYKMVTGDKKPLFYQRVGAK